MRISINRIWIRFLRRLGLWPLSLAKKCRLTFGGAVILILLLALLPPYIWMGQLIKKDYLDTERGKVDLLLLQHFRLRPPGETALAALDYTGAVMDPNNAEIRWIHFAKEEQALKEQLGRLTDQQKATIEALKTAEDTEDNIDFVRKNGMLHSSYVRVFRANDNCISCHNPEGSASAFTQNTPVGAVVIQRRVGDISKTTLLNRIWISIAGLIAGTGAIIAFYWITQRVILRPIRQLRAIANNVAEGNLDIRSSIKTGDEYEKLANAFNHMLDGLQATQQKLRQANTQLDAKIAELSERNIELFKANKLKSEFLANMSHEFKTPLNAILGFAQVLREKPGLLKKEKSQRYAENIITSGNRLLSMINDLLDLAKTQAGKMEMHIEETSIEQLCTSIVGSFALLTSNKKIKVKTKIDRNIPTLTTDAGKIQQILYNFLSNAVKFTPTRGRIEISARMLDEKTVRIAVSDNGCGINPQDQKKIFEKFRQVDGSITRETTGSGLGLAISKELASMLAGTIGLESEQGEGSTFFLDIPVTPAPTEEQARTK